jgi:hypothetical protein
MFYVFGILWLLAITGVGVGAGVAFDDDMTFTGIFCLITFVVLCTVRLKRSGGNDD